MTVCEMCDAARPARPVAAAAPPPATAPTTTTSSMGRGTVVPPPSRGAEAVIDLTGLESPVVPRSLVAAPSASAPAVSAPVATVRPASAASAAKWRCSACTYENAVEDDLCLVCYNTKAASEAVVSVQPVRGAALPATPPRAGTAPVSASTSLPSTVLRLDNPGPTAGRGLSSGSDVDPHKRGREGRVDPSCSHRMFGRDPVFVCTHPHSVEPHPPLNLSLRCCRVCIFA
jgi:hypothetical protein